MDFNYANESRAFETERESEIEWIRIVKKEILEKKIKDRTIRKNNNNSDRARERERERWNDK